MNRKALVKPFSFLLIITFSYVQLMQFDHRFLYHSQSLSSFQKSKQAQFQKTEPSCLVCDYLHHIQGTYTFETSDGMALTNLQKGSRLLALYQVAIFPVNYTKNKNRGPPYPYFSF